MVSTFYTVQTNIAVEGTAFLYLFKVSGHSSDLVSQTKVLTDISFSYVWSA